MKLIKACDLELGKIYRFVPSTDGVTHLSCYPKGNWFLLIDKKNCDYTTKLTILEKTGIVKEDFGQTFLSICLFEEPLTECLK